MELVVGFVFVIGLWLLLECIERRREGERERFVVPTAPVRWPRWRPAGRAGVGNLVVHNLRRSKGHGHPSRCDGFGDTVVPLYESDG